RANLWLAQQLSLGNVRHETFLALHILEDAPLAPDDKVRLADQALSQNPHFARLHLARGKNLARLERSRAAEAAYRAGLAQSPEPDVKTRLLVELGVIVEELTERLELLRDAQALNGNLTAAAMATVTLRALEP